MGSDDASERGDSASRESREKLSQADARVLQAIYDLFRERNAWPTFRTVDLRFDRSLGIADAQAVLAAIPSVYLQRPWHSYGFHDNDEVRLSLRGIRECDGGLEDLELLTRFMRWLCEIEQSQAVDDESDPVAESVDFAAAIGLPVEPDTQEAAPTPEHEPTEPEIGLGGYEAAELSEGGNGEGLAAEQPVSAEVEQNRATLARLRLLADLLPRFWSGVGWREPWRWRVTLDRRGLRPYRSIHDLDQLLGYAERMREQLVRQRASVLLGWNVQPEDAESSSETEQIEVPVQRADEIDVLLTVLRPEISESAGAQLRSGLYDDAIFAAYRRVEAAVQERSGLSGAIGDQLVRQAFKEIADPIRVSARNQDAERLIQLFGGAIGLYKGDRSHKDKPALPCRSLRECLRQLANASALLDLLDRDIAVAPTVRGYDQRGDMLELWVERASAQSQVWLDDRLCDVVRHGPATLILDVAGVPAGEHEMFIADGTRTGPATQVWLTRSPGGAGWQRVREVNIPLFAGPVGLERLDATGLRLTVREAGVISERIVPTTGTYRVGDYVNAHFDVGAPGDLGSPSAGIGPAWIYDGYGGARRQLWESSSLFDGEAYAPEHEPRLMKVSLEPPALILRPGEKTPVLAVGHYTDGVATWTDPLAGSEITSDNNKVVHVSQGTVFAKGYGKTTLRLTGNGLYAASTAHVAAHPAGTLVDVLTGLPPIAGLAWAQDALMVSMRTDELWQLDTDGRYALAAAVPLQPPAYGGTDTIAACENGDLAVRLLGHRDVLVLEKESNYCTSRWVSPGEDGGTVMAMTWESGDLILALHTGLVCRAHADGTSEQIVRLPHKTIVSIDRCDDALLALTTGEATELWRIPLGPDSEATRVILGQEHLTANVAAWLNGTVHFTDFHGGRVLRLDDEQTVELATGLQNPGELTAGPDGRIYIAEFARGAIRCLLP